MTTIQGRWPNAPQGTLKLQLSKYALIGGTSRNAPRFYAISLDATGAMLHEIWGNDELLPEGTTYQITIIGQDGSTLFGPQWFPICGTSPVDLNRLQMFSSAVVPMTEPV
jgi:hypothetical protein